MQVVYTDLKFDAVGHYRPQAAKTLQTMVPDMSHGAAIYIFTDWDELQSLVPPIYSCNARNCAVWPSDKPFLGSVNLVSFSVFTD